MYIKENPHRRLKKGREEFIEIKNIAKSGQTWPILASLLKKPFLNRILRLDKAFFVSAFIITLKNSRMEAVNVR